MYRYNIDMQLTSYIVQYVCMYPHNITDVLPLHVAHLPLLSSLFTVGLVYLKETYSTSQLLCIRI